jgi:hypothetical protein
MEPANVVFSNLNIVLSGPVQGNCPQMSILVQALGGVNKNANAS